MGDSRRIFRGDGEAGGLEDDRYLCPVELGRGGMSVVYRAWDSRMNREVALKVAREEVAADPDIRRRFEEESRIAATVCHPAVLPVFDRGTYQGRPYLAMQLVDGAPLDRAGLPLRDAMICLAKAADAVHHAHGLGIIHRDLKPSNILVARDGRVFLTDFGVARQTASDSRLTAAGTVVGTPAYMSPEQARGEDVDARADVYALGATLYELATGRPPYEGADPQAVLAAVRARPPVPPRKANPQLSRNVESIIRMAMERLPEDRYPTAQALAEDLRLYQNHRRPLARARGFRYYLGREIVRHPVRSAARFLTFLLLAGVLALGILVGSARRTYQRALQEPDRLTRIELLEQAADFWPPARRQLTQERDALAASERAQGAEKLRRLVRMTELEAAIRDALGRRDLPAADERLAELRGLDAPSLGELQRERGAAAAEAAGVRLVERIRERLGAEDLDGAERDWTALPAAHPERAGLHEAIRAARFRAGFRALEKAAAAGDRAAFEPLFTELASPRHAAERKRDETLGAVGRTLGLALAGAGDRTAAIRWLSEAEARGAGSAELYRVRGLAHLAERLWDAAEKDLQRLRQLSPGDAADPPEYWELFHHRSRAAAAAGDWKEAQTQLQEALKLSKAPAVLWHDLGLARWKTVRKPELSLADLDEALKRDPALRPGPAYGPVVVAHVEARSAEALALDEAAARDALWSELLGRLDRITAGDERPEDLRVLRAGLLRRLRRFDEARAELDGTSVPVRLAAARIRAAEAQIAPAPQQPMAEGHALLAGAPERPDLRLWRGLLGARLGRPGALEDLLASEPFAAARLELARLLHGRGQHARALQELDAALAGAERLGDDDLLWLGAEPRAASLPATRSAFRRDVLSLRAKIRFDAKDVAGCVEDCTRLLQDGPAPELLLLRGLSRMALTPPSWAAAFEDLEAYLQAQPQDVRARLAAARAAFELKRHREGEEHCRKLVEAGTDAPEPFYLRGLHRKALGNAVGARYDFEQALSRNPPADLKRALLEELNR